MTTQLKTIKFKKAHKYISSIITVGLMIITTVCIFTDPLNIEKNDLFSGSGSYKLLSIYVLPGFLFIHLWKNGFYLHKNIVKWNEEMIFIKINDSKTTTLNWKDIEDITFTQEVLKINYKNKKNNEVKNIVLNNIEQYSIQELKNIFQNRNFVA